MWPQSRLQRMQSNANATRATRLRAWLADWGNALTVVIVAYALIYLWLMGDSQTSIWSHMLRAVAFLPMNAAASVLAFRANWSSGWRRSQERSSASQRKNRRHQKRSSPTMCVHFSKSHLATMQLQPREIGSVPLISS